MKSVEGIRWCLCCTHAFSDIDECALVTHVCDQNCINNRGGYSCTCNSGYTLDSNGRACNGMEHLKYWPLACFTVCSSFVSYSADVNECRSTTTNQCQQNCTNTVGSYTCTCHTGYRLNGDGRTCSGKWPLIHISRTREYPWMCVFSSSTILYWW